MWLILILYVKLNILFGIFFLIRMLYFFVGNKKIEYDEFEKFMVDKFKSLDEVEEEMRNVFKIFDKDGSGKIDVKELRYVMKSLGEIMIDGEVDEMIKVVD